MADAIPVVLDTDLGTDIDDTWALVQLLRSPALELRGVTTVSGDPHYRAALVARLLEVAGRSDVPIGIGRAGGGLDAKTQAGFVKDWDLSRYAGAVHEDGVGALIDWILSSDRPVTVVSIGPLGNVAAALRREPRIAELARLVGMHGSVRLGYRGAPEPAAEYNVACDPESARVAFGADWPVTLTPLDTCGVIYLKDHRYQRVRESRDPLVDALVENYRLWLEATGTDAERLERRSSTLYDTVAVYLAESEELLEIEELGLRVEDGGVTRIDPTARPLRVATRWRDRDAFLDLLVDRLTSE